MICSHIDLLITQSNCESQTSRLYGHDKTSNLYDSERGGIDAGKTEDEERQTEALEEKGKYKHKRLSSMLVRFVCSKSCGLVLCGATWVQQHIFDVQGFVARLPNGRTALTFDQIGWRRWSRTILLRMNPTQIARDWFRLNFDKHKECMSCNRDQYRSCCTFFDIVECNLPHSFQVQLHQIRCAQHRSKTVFADAATTNERNKADLLFYLIPGQLLLEHNETDTWTCVFEEENSQSNLYHFADENSTFYFLWRESTQMSLGRGKYFLWLDSVL